MKKKWFFIYLCLIIVFVSTLMGEQMMAQRIPTAKEKFKVTEEESFKL